VLIIQRKSTLICVLIFGIILISGCISEEKGQTKPNDTAVLPAETEAQTTSSTISSPLPSENETLPTQISTPSPTPAIRFEGRYIDVHTHIRPSGMSLTEIIQNMDKEGIDMMVIMEVPTAIYQGKPQTEYGIPDAAEKYPGRFIVLYGGEAITLLDSVATKGSYTKADEEKFIALIEYAMKSGKYRGFGEIALRHVSPVIGGEGADVTVSGDHPWMFIMSDIAAKYDVPIDIHMDFETADKGIAGLEKLLDHNKKTKVIWSHTAWSRTGKSVSVELMRQLLERHPNLYSSIKIRGTETGFIDEDNRIKSEWLALFKDYPERFMIGSDIKPGIREDEFRFIKRHRKFLEQLPPEILKRIERDNAKEIFKIN